MDWIAQQLLQTWWKFGVIQCFIQNFKKTFIRNKSYTYNMQNITPSQWRKCHCHPWTKILEPCWKSQMSVRDINIRYENNFSTWKRFYVSHNQHCYWCFCTCSSYIYNLVAPVNKKCYNNVSHLVSSIHCNSIGRIAKNFRPFPPLAEFCFNYFTWVYL